MSPVRTTQGALNFAHGAQEHSDSCVDAPVSFAACTFVAGACKQNYYGQCSELGVNQCGRPCLIVVTNADAIQIIGRRLQ